MGNALHYAPAFDGEAASSIRGHYVSKCRRLGHFARLYEQSLRDPELPIECFEEIRTKIDDILNVLSLDGWSSTRRARVLLVNAIDRATNHARRLRDNSSLIAEFRKLDDARWVRGNENNLALKERLHLLTMEIRSKTDYIQARKFSFDTNREASEFIDEFASFLFANEVPEYAGALQTDEAQVALKSAVEAWKRARGRPQGRGKLLPKWETIDALMKSCGLVGSSAGSVQKDWEFWRNKKRNK